jgi:hypothetical protein
MSEENKTCQTPKEDLMTDALKHYDEASSAIHCWYSDIPKAIEHYYSMDQVKARDEEEAKELLKENGTSHPDKVVLDDLVEAMGMMKGMGSYRSDKPNEEIGGLVKAMGVLRGFDTKSFDEALKKGIIYNPDAAIKDSQTSTWPLGVKDFEPDLSDTEIEKSCCEEDTAVCDYCLKEENPVAKPVFIGRMAKDTPDEDFFGLVDQFTEQLPAYSIVLVYNNTNETVFEIVK